MHFNPRVSNLVKTLIQRKRFRTIMFVAIIAAILIIVHLLDTQHKASVDETSMDDSDLPVVVGELRKGTPSFSTVLPEGKSIDEFGGWTRVSPPNRNPVFAYVDTIDGISINVSQQELPSEFKDDPEDQVRDLAYGYGANKAIKTDEIIIYVGTSAKGPQSAIVYKNKLLILIKANAELTDDSWKKYIKSLS